MVRVYFFLFLLIFFAGCSDEVINYSLQDNRLNNSDAEQQAVLKNESLNLSNNDVLEDEDLVEETDLIEDNYLNFDEGYTIIVRTPENFVHQDAAREHLIRFFEHNVTRVVLLAKNDEDLPHMDSGEVFYFSDIAPIAKDYRDFDFDALEFFTKEAHKLGIEVYAWIPQFHDKVLVDKRPDLQMRYFDGGGVSKYNPNNEYFVNPLSDEVQEYELSIIKEVVKNYDIDGLYLDWIRFDDYNMDLSQESIDKFESEYGFSPLEIDFSVDDEKRRVWNDFRYNQIADYVNRVKQEVSSIKPDLPIGVYVLPIEMREVAQKPSEFENSVDEVAVMAYNDDWGYSQNWIVDGATRDLIEDLEDIDKISVVLDYDDCSDKTLLSNIKGLGVRNIECFYYWDWTEDKITEILK